jgi:hypothetical protein
VQDLTAVADPSTGVASYDSYESAGWLVEGGTSVADAIVGAAYALAGTPPASGYPASYPYSYPGKLTNVTSGSDGPRDAQQYGTLAGAITSHEYGLCLDDRSAGTSPKNPVQVYGCNGGTAQAWTLEPNGSIELKRYCLDVDASGTASGTTIDLYTCNGGGAQQWRMLTNQTIVNSESRLCLDDPDASELNSSQLQIWSCDGDPQQNWVFSS